MTDGQDTASSAGASSQVHSAAAADGGCAGRPSAAASDANVCGSGGFGAEQQPIPVPPTTRRPSLTDTKPPQAIAVANPSGNIGLPPNIDRTHTVLSPPRPAGGSVPSSPTADWEGLDAVQNVSQDSLNAVCSNARRRAADLQTNDRAGQSRHVNVLATKVDDQSSVWDDDLLPAIRWRNTDPQLPERQTSNLSDLLFSRSIESLTEAACSQSLPALKTKIPTVDNRSVQLVSTSLKPPTRKIPVLNKRLAKTQSDIDLWLDGASDIDVRSDGVESLTDTTGSQSTPTSRSSWQKIPTRNDRSFEKMTLKSPRRAIPVSTERLVKHQPKTDPWTDDDEYLDMDDRLSQLEQMSLKPPGRRISVLKEKLVKPPSRTDLWPDEEVDIDMCKEDELERSETLSIDVDQDDESVSTASTVVQSRQHSKEQKRLPTPPAAAQPRARTSSDERTKTAVQRPKKPTPTPSTPTPSKSPRGVTGRTARSRTYDRPTISASAKRAGPGPIFTWNRPSKDDDDNAPVAADDPPPVRGGTRKRPPLDDRVSLEGSIGSGSSGKSPVRGSSGARTPGSKRSDSSKLASRGKPDTPSIQSRSASRSTSDLRDEESIDTLNTDVQSYDMSDFFPDTPTRFDKEISDLAERLQDASRDDASRHFNARVFDLGHQRGGGGQQTVEDVYVEAMALEAEGRVSGQSSLAWRQELARIIESLRHQMRSRENVKAASARLRLVNIGDLKESGCFTQTKARQKNKR